MKAINYSIAVSNTRLSWFVGVEIAEKAIKTGHLIEEEEVGCIGLKELEDAVVDENVDVCLVHHYFLSQLCLLGNWWWMW